MTSTTGKGPTRLDESKLDTRYAIEEALKRLIREQLGGTAFTTMPVWPGALSTKQVAPLPESLRLALLAGFAARRLVVDYAGKLRGEGVSWADIFPLLDLEVSDNRSNAEAAYEFILGPDTREYRFDELYVYWTCDSCKQGVRDRGPYNGHPVDNEPGHAEGCARHQAEIDAYMAGQED